MPPFRHSASIAQPFFFNDTATTEIYTLSLHDALPIYRDRLDRVRGGPRVPVAPATAPVRGAVLLRRVRDRAARGAAGVDEGDRKSTRLNSSHANISYAVFCLNKKNHNIGRLHVRTTAT